MNIHEYQAKELLRRYDMPVPQGCVAFTPDEAAYAARKLGGPAWVVKSQIHAGGRAAGHFVGDDSHQHGVRVVTSIDDVHAAAMRMLGKTLVTAQTGPAGKTVRRVYIEKDCEIARALYLGLLIDAATSRVTIIMSAEGGMDIDAIAARQPESILKLAIDPATGIQPFHARRLAYGLGLSGKPLDAATRFIVSAYRAFTELDASRVEINPLGVTIDGDVMALDATFEFDDNALFRHPDIEAMRDESEADPAETDAARHALDYVRLDGNIGCIANGAGLAMATMDSIKRHGAEPANFLDLGTHATPTRIAAAFRLFLANPRVDAILVNVVGGVIGCDDIAESVVSAVHEADLTVPLVVRLAGTNADLGRTVLRDAGLPIVSASDLADAADKAVAAARATRKKGGQ